MEDENSETGDEAQVVASGKAPPKRGRRFLKLARMTASVAGNYTASRLAGVFQSEEHRERRRQEVHAANGEILAKTLGELKGAVMKVGQMASVATDLLPPELAGALQGLQKDSPPMSFELIAAQIERELGAPPAMLFDHFDEEPFAAASIGQVHRAVTDDGREVVVKVQYPGVDESVDSDLAHLKVALKASGFVSLNRKAMNALFEELRARLHEELDYCNEADNVRLFGELHRDDDFVIVPEVVGERSSKRVLTLTFHEGDPIDGLHDAPYTREIRDLIGENLYRIYGRQMFAYHVVHGDPNPGNYAFLPDGRVILYDYGCVKKLTERQVRIFREVARAALVGDYERLDGLLEIHGSRVPGTPSPPPDFYKRWCDALLRDVIEGEVFDYGTSQHHAEIMALIPMSMPWVTSFQPPAELSVIDRVVAGLHNIFRKIEPRLRWLPLLEEHLAMSDELGPLEEEREDR